MRALLFRIPALFVRRRFEEALDAEVAAHLELLTADYERQG